MRSRILPLSPFLLACLGLFAPHATATTVLYTITVDTSSQDTNDAWIEFQFNPSSLGSDLAYADITAFTTDGAFDPPGSGANTGDSSGQLPGTVSMDNATSFNDYFEEMTLGDTIQFNLALSGPALDAPTGAGGGTFALDFLNAAQTGYLFTNDPINDVPVLTVDINPDGSTTATTYPSSGDGTPVVTFTGPLSIPEPATLGLAGAALLGLAAVKRRVRKK